MTEPLPDDLVAYLTDRDQSRQRAAAELYGRLTERERGLVREAAVMGYVQGVMHPRELPVPRDSEMVFRVVDGCRSNADRYPLLGTLTGAADSHVRPGQVYRSLSRPSRIVVKRLGEPGGRLSGQAYVATLGANGQEIRRRWVFVSDLYAEAEPLTSSGRPRQTGYALVQDTEVAR